MTGTARSAALRDDLRWPHVPLVAVATIDRKAVKPNEIHGGELYVGLENITGRGEFEYVVDAGEAGLKSNKFAFTENHVLYGKLRPYLAKIAAPNFEGICSTDILPIRPGADLDRRYLLHYLRTPEMVAHAATNAVGISLPRLSPKVLESFEVPLPTIEEQRRIAAVLDAAEALRAKRRSALVRLDSLTQAIFIDMFGDPVSNPYGWPRVPLGELLASATYGTSRKAGAGGRFSVLRMGNLTVEGHLDLGDMKFLDLDEREVDRHTVRKGDVLFNRTNSADLVGKTAVYRLDECMAYAGYLVRLRPKPSLNSEYLGTFMNLPTTKLLLRSMCKSIVGMANINAREVQTVRLPLPPQDRQAAFSAAQADVAQQRVRLERQLISLDTLFASLQQRAFRGEL